MNRSLELRIPLGLGESLLDCIYQAGGHEHVAFGLVSHSVGAGLTTLHLRRLIPLDESAYVPNHSHGAVWRGSAMFPVMEAAMDENLGIVVFHAHDHEGVPGLSNDDLRSADKLIPMFQKRVPGRPHGTIVVSRTHASGLVWLPSIRKPVPLARLRLFGSAIVDLESQRENPAPVPPAQYARQTLVVSREGQARLRAAKIGVVGAGGGGSHVIQQLAYLGVGEIVVVDPDTYEESNRHRLVSALKGDLGRSKVAIFHRLVKKIGLSGRVHPVAAALPDTVAVEALRQCDIIVGCVDTLFARSDLQELASRYLIPYVDIGAAIRVVPDTSASDPRVQVAGNIFTFIPGSFCLWCIGFLSPEKIEAEQNGPTRGYFEKNTQEAQVVSINGVLASQAVTEVLQLLVGFRGVGLRHSDLALGSASTLRGYKKFDGVAGTLQEWGGIRRPDCLHCGNVLGGGDVVFAPASNGQTAA
jgi:ThiF family